MKIFGGSLAKIASTSLIGALFFFASIGTLHPQQRIKATLRADPLSYSGKCPTTIKFEGKISVTKPGRVQYKFIRSDGASAPIRTLNFDRPGTKRVSTTLTIGKSYSGWQAVKVLYPQDMESNKAHFRIRCKVEDGLLDLTIEDIYPNNNCQVVVKVKNKGPGTVPDEVWTVHKPKSAGVYLYINDRKWGGASIWKFDPGRSLQSSGGTAKYTSSLKVSDTAKITAIVDLWNEVKESNEKNNKRIEKLICEAPPKKDLTIKIMRCPKAVKPGQNLDAGFQVVGKSTFPSALKNIAVDIILTSKSTYPSPAPFARYSPNYSDGVLLKGGREHISFAGPVTVNVKLNGSNTIPVDTPPGVYYLSAVIDAGNKVKEGSSV